MKKIRLVRDEPMFPGGPLEAEVPEGEHEKWLRFGWRVKENEAQSQARRARTRKAQKNSGTA